MRYNITGKLSDGPISRLINRRISAQITRLILYFTTDVSPNLVTLITFLIGIFSAALYLIAGPLIAGIAIQLASILDGVDGEIARALDKKSKLGAFLDSVSDRIVDIAVIVCMTLYLAETINIYYLILVSLLAMSGTIMVSYVRGKSQQMFGENPEIERCNFATRDVRLFIIFLGSVLGFLFETLLLIAILTYAQVITRVIIVANYWKSQSIQTTAEISKAVDISLSYDSQQVQFEDFRSMLLLYGN